MEKTRIEWADSTWNPVTGCLHGCEYCYARRMVHRFGGLAPDRKCHVLDEANRTTKGKADPYPYGFAPTYHRYRLDQPGKWVIPRTIFVCSMADLFGEWVPDEWIEDVFEACKAAPQHRYLFLTKNPKRYGRLAEKGKLPKDENFWWGSTVTGKDSKIYPGRITDNTFISIEPLLEPLDLCVENFRVAKWIIIGAESGNRKDKVIPKKEWVDNICEAADITHAAVFMKDSLIPIVGEENMRREFPW